VTPDEEEALELLELDEDAEPIRGVMWGPVLEDLAPLARHVFPCGSCHS
jgi:hypothetical protein